MDNKRKIFENALTLNQLIPLTINIVDKYADDIKDAEIRSLMRLVGSQATYLYNMGTITLEHADVSACDRMKLEALVERMDTVIDNMATGLGLKDDDDDDDDDDNEIPSEAIDDFAKECKLNKTETAVLRKIVEGKGHPNDMTEKDIEVALKMAGKIEKAGEKLGL